MGPAQPNPILIVTGPPGVGKTTTAGILAARSDRAVHLEADHFFRFIRAGYVEPWTPESHEQNRVVMGVVAGAAAGYAAAGYFTIVDGIVIPRWFLGPLSDELRRAGHLVAYAVLRAPLAVCTERMRQREKRRLVAPETIEQLWRSFADLGELERHVIELDGERPEQAADLLGERLDEGRLAV
jgi:tRNA uridine 5-carbamoylmethylation protein Kti12